MFDSRDSTQHRQPDPATAHLEAPAVCPECRSAAVVTTSKLPDSDSYWRCTACGEVWNPARTGRQVRRYR